MIRKSITDICGGKRGNAMSRYIDADALKIDISRLHALNDEAEIRRAYELNPHSTMTDFEDTLVSVFDTIDEAPTIEVPKWIPCSERLPEDSGDYLVRPSDNALDDYSEFEEIMIMSYDADCEAFGWWASYFDPISLGYVDSDFNKIDVIAWMPLPKAYEETDHE